MHTNPESAVVTLHVGQAKPQVFSQCTDKVLIHFSSSLKEEIIRREVKQGKTLS